MTGTIAYIRRSSESGDDYSFETQTEACQKYAEAHTLGECEIIREHVSGTKHLRDRTPDAGARLWTLIQSGQVSNLIVYTADRLSRAKLSRTLAMVEDILETGTRLHSTDAGEVTDANDIGAVIRWWQAGEERKKIVERLWNGKISKSKVAYVGGGQTPYGYIKIGERKKSTLEIDEEQAVVIKRAVGWLLIDGLPLRTIVRRLNKAGITPPSPKSAFWNHTSLRIILLNPVLTGFVRFNGNDVYYPGLAIIDAAQAEQIRDVLADNKARASRNRKRDYLLAGHLTCKCGRNMTGSAQQRGEKLHTYYRCWRATDDEGRAECDNRRMIRAGEVDAVAWGYVLFCAQPEQLEQWRAELRASESHDLTAPLRQELAQIDHDIDQARRKIAAIMSRFGDETRRAVIEQRDATIDAANNTIEELQTEREKLTRKVADEAGRLAQQAGAQDAIEKARAKLATANFERKRQVLRAISLRARLIVEADGSRKLKITSLIGPEKVFDL